MYIIQSILYMIMTTNIYILELVENKYYIGKSKNPQERYIDHFNGNGSEWTIKYKPIKIKTIIEHASIFDEDRYVKEYMSIYGIDSVRGGSYSTITLSDCQKSLLINEIRGATDKCIKCGRKGHFIKNCYAKTNIDGTKINYKNDMTKTPNKYKKIYKNGRWYTIPNKNYLDDKNMMSNDSDIIFQEEIQLQQEKEVIQLQQGKEVIQLQQEKEVIQLQQEKEVIQLQQGKEVIQLQQGKEVIQLQQEGFKSYNNNERIQYDDTCIIV